MKKILLTLIIASVTISAQAQHRHHRHNNYNHNWVAPAIIGGILGYALANNHVEAATAPVLPPPVVYYPQNGVVYSCPLGFRPVYNRVWTTDRWGRAFTVDNFVGCQ